MSSIRRSGRSVAGALLITFALFVAGCLSAGGSKAPTITVQPRDATVFETQTAYFDVGAEGQPPNTFQWFRNGVAIAGATAPTYTTPAVTAADSGARFSVTMTNAQGSATSSAATLTVSPPPVVSSSTGDQTVAVGGSASFTVTATGSTLTYQWRRDDVIIASATSATYTIAATVASDDGAIFTCDVINPAGKVTTAPARLTVKGVPAVTVAPLSQTVAVGETVVLGVTATGGALTYQWRRNGVNIAGATSRTYALQGAAATDSGAAFTVVVTNDLGSATSAPAIVTVLTLPVVALPALPAELALSKSQTASANFTLVRRSDGSIASWGFNTDGERGDGTTGSASATPGTVTLPAGTRAVSVAAGETHGLVLLNTGDVYAWGLNAFGQLGFGDNVARPTPTKVPLSLPAIAIAAGRDFSVAVLNDGSVVTWGLNDAGQIADGTLATRLSPVPVAGLAGIVALAAGNGHVLALTAAGTVWSWGANAAGQLGDGTYKQRRTPVLLPVNGIARIRAGGDISVLITTHRIAYGFGENTGAQLVPTSVDVGTPTSILTDAVDAGPADTLLLVTRSDGTVSASGTNETGSLGDGTTTARTTFQPVSVVTGAITAAAGGRSFSGALRSDGTVLMWGDNSALQLGNSTLSTTAGTTTPTAVPGFDAIP